MVEESSDMKAAGASAGDHFVILHWRLSSSAVSADSDRTLQAGGGAGYTSLRDLICLQRGSPEAVRSTYTPGGGGGGDIRIRNRLVKQAAQAYLKPTPSGAEYYCRRRRNRSPRRALDILTCDLAVEPLDSCIAFLRHLFRQ